MYKTGKLSLIDDMIKVVAQGVEYGVVVYEISNWEPYITEDGQIDSAILNLLGWGVGGGRRCLF